VSSGPRSQASLLAKLLAILALISLVAAACGGGDDDNEDAGNEPGIVEGEEEEEAGDPVMGGTLNYGVEAESAGWQPCVDSHSESGTIVMRALYDTLTARSAEGEIEPYLAESIDGSDDLKEWTVKLREGIKFHDGTDLDSAAVKANFDAAKAPTSRCAGALAPITEMQVVDDLTVKYVLANPYGPFPELLSGAAGMIFSPANATAKGADVSANPVGAGPFKFQSWERDSKLTLVKNENYWQEGKPYLDSVVVKPIPDEDARLASLSSGEVDIMFTLRQEYVRQARDLGDEVTRLEKIGNNSGGSIFNTALAPVDDKRVRKALAHAMNQKDLIKILGGEGISPETTQFFSKDSPWYSEKVAAGYPKYDVAAAKELVEEYVNDPARSDKQPVGSPIKVVFNCPPDPTLVAVAQGYQQMAAAAGIEMELKQVEQATHINNAVGKPPYTSADYMINCWRLGGQADPDSVLFNQYSNPEGQAANVTNFTSPKVQELLKIGRESADFDTRFKAYEDLGLLFNEEVPHVWTGATAASTVFKPAVKNVNTYEFPDGETKGEMEQAVANIAQIWIEQ
jgi:peptide/nickel transport system substrate-binding protein